MKSSYWLVLIGFVMSPLVGAQEPVDFTRDVRPILSNHCFQCHGPNEKSREGGFRLDAKESALGLGDSGESLIVPGKPAESELVRRIVSDDELTVMPPPDADKALTKQQIETLRRWIEQGAKWSEHWSLIPPSRPALPVVRQADWVCNAIDDFILARLEREGLRPAEEASKEQLIRRVTFDLTGLPPTLAEVDAFLADNSANAYERLVDRLLESPRFGEHMARFWLDAARYGDTHGLHLDNYREMWPYRDWVIRAYNSNMPFDQFTIEQLAGDLLDNPSLDQQIASGFNRCHVTTSEGGSIAEEVYVRNVVDRVVTTGTVFMGMTLECCRCHEHKYDPFTMQDFYSLFAFFNSLEANPLDGNKKDHAPVVKVLTPEQERQVALLQREIEGLRGEIQNHLATIEYVEPQATSEQAPDAPQERVWIEDQIPSGAAPSGDWQWVEKPEPVYSGTRSSKRTATELSQHFIEKANPPLPVGEGDVLFAHVYLDPQNPPQQIMLQWNDGSWEHRAYWGGNQIDWGAEGTPSRRRLGDLPAAGAWVRLEVPARDVGLAPGAAIQGWAFTQYGGTVWWDAAGIVTHSPQARSYRSFARWLGDQQAAKGKSLPQPLQSLVSLDDKTRTEEQQTSLLHYFLEHACLTTRPQFEPLQKQIDDKQKQVEQLRGSGATTLVFRELPSPKPAFVLNRGEYDQRKEPVTRATPKAMLPFPEKAPRNRLGLAQWLVDPGHPLTARVTVNRFWQQFFGTGLVKTSEDFGSQGEPPSHPQLLDWLAVNFREHGWDVKAILKKIVMSASYRQSSRVTPELLERDPQNRLLARGPRFRLDAEMLRDQALAVSGLLVNQLGGPSVKPPQPDGLWFAVGYSGSNTVRFKADQGSDKVHRRTLYTFIKRTSPPPQMSTFDAPSREACVVRRERTSTPLQALLLLNDEQFVEAARVLAQRTIREGGADTNSRAAYMYRLCTARQIDPQRQEELRQLYEDMLAVYSNEVGAAEQVITMGNAPTDDKMLTPELAAWTMVANLVLNLDEVIMKN